MSKRYVLRPGRLGIIAAPPRRWAAYSVTFLSAIAPIVRPSACLVSCPSRRHGLSGRAPAVPFKSRLRFRRRRRWGRGRFGVVRYG